MWILFKLMVHGYYSALQRAALDLNWTDGAIKKSMFIGYVVALATGFSGVFIGSIALFILTAMLTTVC